MECLHELVGVTKNDCPCILEGLTDEQKELIKVSKSGLYLDDIIGAVTLSSIANIDNCGNMATYSLDAIEKAEKQLLADITTTLNGKYKPSRPNFMGNLGQMSYTKSLPVAKRFQVFRLRPNEVSDTSMLIKGIRIATDTTGTYPVYILRAPSGTDDVSEVWNGVVESVGNQYSPVVIPDGGIEVPLSVYSQRYDYFIVWDRGIMMETKPKDTKTSAECGKCGNGAMAYFEMKGGEADSFYNLSNLTADNYTHGIILTVELKCTAGNLICREYDQNNAIAVVLSYMLAYKANQFLIQQILDTNEINRYTMMNREALYGKRASFIKEYDMRMMYLSNVIDISSSDCFICRDTQMFKATLLS